MNGKCLESFQLPREMYLVWNRAETSGILYIQKHGTRLSNALHFWMNTKQEFIFFKLSTKLQTNIHKKHNLDELWEIEIAVSECSGYHV